MPWLKFKCSKRGPNYHFPIGSVRFVPQDLAEGLVKEGAAVKTTAPETDPPAGIPEEEWQAIIRRHDKAVDPAA